MVSPSTAKGKHVYLPSIIKDSRSLTLELFSCNRRPLCVQASIRAHPHQPHQTWGASLLVVPWVMKSFTSDPEVTCLLPVTRKLWQVNGVESQDRSPPKDVNRSWVDFYADLVVMGGTPPLSCWSCVKKKKKTAKTKDLNEIQSHNITLQMSRFQSKITCDTRNE